VNFETARRIKNRHEDELMSLAFVQGVGLRQTDGEPAITVYVAKADPTQKLPLTLEGVPVVIEQSGLFEAQ
jgi:hypothetical protein